jgi:3-isopropylmalate dehydrogenase
MATFLAVAMLLEYLGQDDVAGRVRAAVEGVLREGPRTPDLGGTATTAEITTAVIAQLGRELTP